MKIFYRCFWAGLCSFLIACVPIDTRSQPQPSSRNIQIKFYLLGETESGEGYRCQLKGEEGIDWYYFNQLVYDWPTVKEEDEISFTANLRDPGYTSINYKNCEVPEHSDTRMTIPYTGQETQFSFEIVLCDFDKNRKKQRVTINSNPISVTLTIPAELANNVSELVFNLNVTACQDNQFSVSCQMVN